MRKFVISDIHGFGNVYYSIMNYLDNLSKEEDIEIYINGDLIDYGYESAEILLDIKKRMEDNKFKITYLGGNHELLMHEAFKIRRKGGFISPLDNWYLNGGDSTDYGLYDILGCDDKVLEVGEFVSNLKIYHKFDEEINGKNIVLIHAACLDKINDVCDLQIKDDNQDISYAVWTREHELYGFLGAKMRNIHKNIISNSDYFTIVGHTPNSSPLGFVYNQEENYLNIDGGCGSYVTGNFKYNHFPLVEICSGYLKILTFNSDNEIICGNYFDGNNIFSYTTKEIEEARKYLDNSVKIKKLSLNEDGIVVYK